MRNNKYDSKFMKYKSAVSNELTVKWKMANATEDSKRFDWYVWPFPNNTLGRLLNY